MGRDFAIFFASMALFSCINLLPAVATTDPPFTGTLQADGSLKFTLPPSFFMEVRHHSCDSQWFVDSETVAIIDKDEIKRKPSVKQLTNTSITVDTCSHTARYFIDCLDTGFRKDIVYMCVTPTSAAKSPSPVSLNEAISSLPIPGTRHDRNHYATDNPIHSPRSLSLLWLWSCRVSGIGKELMVPET